MIGRCRFCVWLCGLYVMLSSTLSFFEGSVCHAVCKVVWPVWPVCYICSLQSFFSAKSMLSLSRFLSLCAVVCVSHRAPACISHGRALCWLISAMFFAACFTHTRQILETKSLPLLSSALRHISTRLFVRDYWARCVLIILASICCGLPSGNLTVHPDQSDRRCCCCCCCCCCCSLLFCGN